jgi:prevent-host-death family protein
MCGYMTAVAQVSVRELKNQTTAILRRVERGERVAVTKRGRVVAVIQPAAEGARRASDSLYRQLQRHIEARIPALRRVTPAAERRTFEKISRKVADGRPYKSWQEMDRAVKGDHFGLSR